jgi:hypothetical protein
MEQGIGVVKRTLEARATARVATERRSFRQKWVNCVASHALSAVDRPYLPGIASWKLPPDTYQGGGRFAGAPGNRKAKT